MSGRSSRRAMTPPSLMLRQQDHPYRLTQELKFITPLFGGGVRLDPEQPHLKTPDEETPVRGASLRGQLRTWWRRTCTTGLSPQVLRQREALLWGWASTQDQPSKGLVSLTVDARSLSPSPVQVFQRNERKQLQPVDADRAYGAFPLQPAQKDGREAAAGVLTRWIGKFQVTLELRLLTADAERRVRQAWSTPAPGAGGHTSGPADWLWSEVARTWRAFVLFGGLGARTRRGFGAVQVVSGGPALDQVVSELGWGNQLRKVGAKDPDTAHTQLLAKLKSFRQGANVGRNPGEGPKRPGRSRWPEPDEIRALTGQHDPSHRVRQVQVRKFPRAAFGLPLIFHFKDREDPQDTSLQPKGAERLASPLLLRPVVDHDGTVWAVALLLPSRRELEDRLKNLDLVVNANGRVNRLPVSGQLSPDEARQIKPLNGEPDVLQAFLTFFAQNTREGSR